MVIFFVSGRTPSALTLNFLSGGYDQNKRSWDLVPNQLEYKAIVPDGVKRLFHVEENSGDRLLIVLGSGEKVGDPDQLILTELPCPDLIPKCSVLCGKY